jgi:hypothetical protein
MVAAEGAALIGETGEQHRWKQIGAARMERNRGAGQMEAERR